MIRIANRKPYLEQVVKRRSDVRSDSDTRQLMFTDPRLAMRNIVHPLMMMMIMIMTVMMVMVAVMTMAMATAKSPNDSDD